MPPNPTTNKEAILSAAISLVREHGMESVNARSIASVLNCSTKPLFRIYKNMDALKQDVIVQLNIYYNAFMEARMSDNNRLLSQGIAYVESSPKKCVNCSQLKMILSCRLLGHLFDDLFMIVVVGKHIEHTAACAPFIMLIDQD